MPGFPLRFSSMNGTRVMEAGLTLGEHNEAVLREYLGYSTTQIAALEREGVLRRGER